MNVSAAALAEAYLAHMKALGARPQTLQGMGLALSRFFEHLRKGRVRDVRRVGEAHVVSFLRRLETHKSGRTGRPLSVSTRAAYLSGVHTFFRFLESRRVVLRDPARGVPLPKRRRLPRPISEAFARRLMAAPDPSSAQGRRDRALLELLYGTGLRLSECARLDLADVDLVSGTLLVRDGKGRKDRYVPLLGQALRALELYLREARSLLERPRRAHKGALFLSKYGVRLGSVSVRKLVSGYGQAVGAGVSTHMLRHSCATHLLEGGADVRQIQELLGHKHIATTALYTKVDLRGLTAMMERCHPRERV